MVISRMVMEETNDIVHPHSPTADNLTVNNNNNSPSTNVYLVGLEFVRQYYTVMNQGPLYLHRFYSDDSSFVHGVSARDSKVVYGQQEIHKRIQTLNFRNCHAKIRQVDSHETLGNGVVIQVTGELSNNGQPMRRFMQTFVLAPQSPKRYYVRNDIFHYQDEVFCDEDVQTSPPVEANLDQEDAEDVDDKESEVNDSDLVPVAAPSPPLATTVVNAKPSPMADVIRSLGSKQQQGTGGSSTPPAMNQPLGQTSPGLVNDINNATTIVNNTNKVQHVTQGKFNSNNNSGTTNVDSSTTATTPTAATIVSGPTSGAGDDGVSVVSINRVLEEDAVVISSSVTGGGGGGGSGPKTYANLFKSNSISSPSVSTPSAPQQPPSSKTGANGPTGGSPGSNVTVSINDGGVTSPPQVSPQPSALNNQRQNDKTLPPRNPRGPGAGSGFNRDRDNRDRHFVDRDRDRRERLSSRSSNTLNDDTGSIDGERRRPVNTYPDANQLFVGNLPHTITPSEIREIFSEFGEVADIKIQKPAPKSSGPKVPYFAFVVFEEPSSAQAALKKQKISMKISDGQDRRLNVEEKRSRPNMGNAGGGGSSYFNRENVVNNSTSANHSGNNSSVGGGGGTSGGGGGHGGGRNYGGSSYNDQRPPQQTHTRTFRGSNRGGGGGGGGNNNSGERPPGGRGSAAAGGHNNNSGSFQGGRTSPNRSYNNNKR